MPNTPEASVTHTSGPGRWSPTQVQGKLLVELSSLVADSDPPAWELLETAAVQLAGAYGDTCIISLLSDDGRWLHPLGLADPDLDVSLELDALAGSRMRADRGFTRHVLSTRGSLLLPETSTEVISVGRPELAAYAARWGVCSTVIAPMRSRGAAVGHVALLRRRAGEPYCTGDEAFVQVVADWLALAIQGGAQAAIRSASATGDDGDEELSPREREVLTLLALGHTNREIAEELVLSVRTVEWHRSRIQWKLGVRGRAALGRIARARGLIA